MATSSELFSSIRQNATVEAASRSFQNMSLILAILLLWEVWVTLQGIPSFVLPKPTGIANEILTNSGVYIDNSIITIKEVVLGLIAGTLFGIVSAIAIFYIDFLRKTLYPFLAMNYVVPKIALAPLFVFWFGAGISSKVLLVALIVFFPLLVNTFTGLVEIDDALVELGRSYGIGELFLLWKIRLPAALPYIGTAFKLGSVMSVIGAVVAEFVASNEGLGALVVGATSLAQTTKAFGAVFVTIGISLLFYGIAVYLDRRLLFWYSESDSA